MGRNLSDLVLLLESRRRRRTSSLRTFLEDVFSGRRRGAYSPDARPVFLPCCFGFLLFGVMPANTPSPTGSFFASLGNPRTKPDPTMLGDPSILVRPKAPEPVWRVFWIESNDHTTWFIFWSVITTIVLAAVVAALMSRARYCFAGCTCLAAEGTNAARGCGWLDFLKFGEIQLGREHAPEPTHWIVHLGFLSLAAFLFWLDHLHRPPPR